MSGQECGASWIWHVETEVRGNLLADSPQEEPAMLRPLHFILCLLIMALSPVARGQGPDGSEWARKLQTEVAGADRLRIRTGGTCHRRVEEEQTLAELADAVEIGRMVKFIDIDD